MTAYTILIASGEFDYNLEFANGTVYNISLTIDSDEDLAFIDYMEIAADTDTNFR